MNLFPDVAGIEGAHAQNVAELKNGNGQELASKLKALTSLFTTTPTSTSQSGSAPEVISPSV